MQRLELTLFNGRRFAVAPGDIEEVHDSECLVTSIYSGRVYRVKHSYKYLKALIERTYGDEIVCMRLPRDRLQEESE